MTDSILLQSFTDLPAQGRDTETEGARDENDAIIRQEKATREQFKELVTVFLDGYRVDMPKAVPVTDAQGNKLRDPDGRPIPRGSTIYDAALRLVADRVWTDDELHRRIPVLCHQPHLPPVGVCRMCSVWIVHTKRGQPRTERKLLPACHHAVTDGMRVTTRAGREGMNPAAEAAVREWALDRGRRRAAEEGKPWGPDDEANLRDDNRKAWPKFLKDVGEWAVRIRDCQGVLAELLVADHRKPDFTPTRRYVNELEAVAEVVGVDRPRRSLARGPELPPRNAPADRRSRRLPLPMSDRVKRDDWNRTIEAELPYSSRTVVVDHDRCILCDRCVRACSDVKPFKVIGHTGKGYDTRISFDLDDPMGASSCVQCGECMTACPTGALSVRRRVQPRAWDDSPQTIPLDPNVPFPREAGFLTAEEVQAVTLRYVPPGGLQTEEVRPFAAVPFAYLKWNEGAVRRWVIPPGGQRVLCREGEYASTAFLTDGSGACQIYGRGARGAPTTSFLARLFRPADDLGGLIYTAPGTDLIQGEMACLTHARRSASVVAVADRSAPMTVYEITRNLLDMMQRTPALRQVVGGLYTARAVEACVRLGRRFRRLLPDDALRGQVAQFLLAQPLQLRRLDAGQTVIAQGDLGRTAESYFYIIRYGTLRVSQAAGGTDRTLATLSGADGDYFGEKALLAPERAARTASVVTLDPVEVVLVPRDVFLDLCDQFPQVRTALQAEGQSRKPVPSDVLSEYVGQGLYQGQRLLALDLTKCTRCDECTKACADSHPDGHARLLRDGLRFGQFLVATSCRSCHTPYCMDGCPVDAIHRRGSHLEVVIEDHCIGCGLCERNCPYGSIHMVPRATPNKAAAGFAGGDPNATAARKAVNCDLCNGTEPYCVHACPHDAAVRTDGKGLLQLVLGRKE